MGRLVSRPERRCRASFCFGCLVSPQVAADRPLGVRRRPVDRLR
jgi:hypothetical protein